MCTCRKVESWEVAYRTVGSAMMMFHKVCGDWLSEPQRKLVENELSRNWQKERDIRRGPPTKGSLTFIDDRIYYRCRVCGALTLSKAELCPFDRPAA